ncbi:MAG: porin family protein [Pseudomonadales bacterium]|nr:porin family protein [Pseudomonadales bacterium]
MSSRFFKFVTPLLLTLCAQQAYAMNDGFYIGATAEAARFEITNENGIRFEDTQTISTYVGYNFMPFLGIELGARTFTDINNKNKTIKLGLNQAFVGIVTAGELSKAIDIFIKAHITQSKLEVNSLETPVDDSSDIGWKYEIGLIYNFTNYLALTGKIDHGVTSYNSDEFNYSTTTAGLGLQLNF